ncbi:MAG: NAD(P)-dependent oxidoreductase [Leptospiraceae bacterium]|nr:NAD(P)-dependent oxidoreductase [Leptospiraceae bacterium]
MKVFVTGGTGFLGRRLVDRLLNENHEVVILTRSIITAEKLLDSKVKKIQGTHQNIQEWGKELEGVDILVHCASPVEFWGQWNYFQESIIDFTKRLLEFSEKFKIKRFIYISSESVLQKEKDLVEIDETETYPDEPNSFYGKAKMIAEKELIAFRGSTEVIILRPTFIWGKGMPALNPMISKIKSGGFMWIDDGKSLFEMVHVENVVEAIFLSFTKGKPGDIYIITDNSPSTVKEFLTKLLRVRGIVPPGRSMSSNLAKKVVRVIEFIWKIFQVESPPPISQFELAFVSQNRKYNINKIINELGYKPKVEQIEGLTEMMGL